MTDIVSLHNDNAQHYIKALLAHLTGDKISMQDFQASARSKIMSSLGIKKALYEDVKNFYSQKKSNLFLLKDPATNQYQGHFIIKFNKLEKNDSLLDIKPQKFSKEDGFGVDENDGEGYLSLSRMSVKKGLYNEENVFQNSYIKIFEKLESLNVPQIIINSKSNETFDMLCKFCDGKKTEDKYIIPVNVKAVKQAFNEKEIISIVRNKESIGEIVGAMKQMLEDKKQKSIAPKVTRVISAFDRLNKFREFSK